MITLTMDYKKIYVQFFCIPIVFVDGFCGNKWGRERLSCYNWGGGARGKG